MNLRSMGCNVVFIIALSLPITLAEDWSWGPAGEKASFKPLDNSTARFDSLESNSSSEAEPSDREPRFLGISEKLCSLGIGTKCNTKPYPDAIDSHYGPPPVLGSSVTSSSYATLDYDKYNKEGHGYPSGPSKAPVGGYEPSFVPPKPYPQQSFAKPYPVQPDTQYTKPAIIPTYEAPKPAYKVPGPTYAAPKPAYKAPKPSIIPTYEAPKPVYKVPGPTYEAPKPAYEVPPTYEAPKPAYKAPKPAYQAPNPSHINVNHEHVNTDSVVQHIHTHTHIHQGVKENVPSGSSVFVSTGSFLPSSGKTIGQSPFEGQITGSESQHIIPSGPGIISSVPGGIAPPVSGQVSGSGFQSTGHSASVGGTSSFSSGGFSSATFDGQVNSNFGGQVSGSGFQSTGHSASVGGTSSFPTGGFSSATFDGQVNSNFGGQVSGNGFQSTAQSASAGGTSSFSTGGLSSATFDGQVNSNFGGQVSGKGFQSTGQSASVGGISSFSTGGLSSATFEGQVNNNFGGQVGGTGFHSSGLSGVSATVSGGRVPPFKGQVGSTFGGESSSTGFHSSGAFGSGSFSTNVASAASTGIIQQSSFGGQVTGNGFQSSINAGSGLPVVPARPFPGSIIEENTPGYQEDCRCVAKHLCPIGDIIPRHASVDIRALIDARSRVSDILSNATDIEETEITTTIAPEDDTEITTTIAPEDNTVVPDIEEESRQKRDLLTTNTHSHDDVVDYQERQFSGYAPSLTGCQPNHVCCRNPVYAAPRQHYTCGKSNAAGLLGRVKNPSFVDDNSEFAEYPWQAAILKLDQGESVYVCGAVLVSDSHLLTAAHCVKKLQSETLIIRLGDWDVTTAAEFYQHVEIPVSNVVIHPEYYAGNLQNDIALMTLQYPVDFDKNPHITPVCLPEKHDNFVGQRCHSTGWGKDAHGDGGKFQRVLKEVEVPVVSHYQCQAALKHTHLGAGFSLHEGNICAGGEEGRDTCEGDGGGPLVCRGQNGNAQLVGLVSWGIGCGKVGIPGVYVNVAHYLDWIRAASH
ncbi:uncharacterized protein [Palaemon carinicauda]|uniref:uncharacterized protein n=1 Tax=Palaemon carinicauda TaxID=392227 RepID=UPI0035B5DA9B